MAPGRLALALVALLLAGCAAPGVRPVLESERLPRTLELAATPFFPQDAYQCGPAALATVLGAAGIDIAPEALTAQVYVPARRGSLQVEMLAAARRNGALAFLIPAELDALLDELRAGHPVLVMQNLGLSWAPSWHYAVAVGYDLERGEITLRSGTLRRQQMSLDTFMHTWNRSGRWAFVALPPGQLPATDDEQRIEAATIDFARTAPAAAAREAYRAASARFPHNLALSIGAAGSAYRVGDLHAARALLEEARRRHPHDGAVLNNLAQVAADQGQLDEAFALASQALERDARWHDAARDTLAHIARLREQRAASASR